MKIVAVLLFAAVAVLSGCATRPQNIPPAYVSELVYRDLTCEQLTQEHHRLIAAFRRACLAQHKARRGDTIGVVLLGLPTASLSGDNIAAEIARLKGEIEAVRRAGLAKQCQLPETDLAAIAAHPDKA